MSRTKSKKVRTNKPKRSFGCGIILILLMILAGTNFFCVWIFLQRVERLYRGHIYPNTYALGVNLSAMSPDDAAEALRNVADQANPGTLVLTDGEQQWSYPWTEAGMNIDADATAQAAYQIGRDGTWQAQLNVWLRYHNVPTSYTLNAENTRGMLETLSQEASLAPVEPSIRLENGEVVIVPGAPGRVLNVSNTLARLTQINADLSRIELPLVFDIVEPEIPDTANITAQVEEQIARSITISAYDILTEETLQWTLARTDIAAWLHLVPGAEGLNVNVNLYAIHDTLNLLSDGLGDGRRFRTEEAAQQIFNAHQAGEEHVQVYLTHPQRTYTVKNGDTLVSISAQFGMPPGLVAQVNANIDVNRIHVGEQLNIPSQDILTPYMPVTNKKIVVNLENQRVRLYENGVQIQDWTTSTGIKSSPTHRGVFQVLSKDERAYASQWDLWMPYFVSVYPAGGGVENGFHELPILASGARLWEGTLGQPASFGCIILGIPQAETLYNWAEIGVVVVIE